ncbi:MAG: hypothetical protein IJ509_00715 [Bacilli bacterium]|nr:hypothetical protein [Bacilli bacterium]
MRDINYRLDNLKFKTLRKTIDFQVPNYRNNGFIEKTYGKSKLLTKMYGMYIVPVSYVQHKKPRQLSNDICKYTKKRRIKIHTDLECMNYETIKDIVNNPFYDKTVELNDIIIPKCASQYGVCYVSEIEITRDNLDFIYKDNKLIDKDVYQNIIIIDKNIKGLLLREGCGIKEMRKKFKRKETIGKKPLV